MFFEHVVLIFDCTHPSYNKKKFGSEFRPTLNLNRTA